MITIPDWLKADGTKVRHLFIKTQCGAQKITFNIDEVEVICVTNKLNSITCYGGNYDKLTHSSWNILDKSEKKNSVPLS